ncbi:methylmalonyl-CoA mutase family protein [Streptomyces sp. 6N223]|uniref:methylmalonyl-CoA mutase family protein n=1 Tax=Streptomyces sp. 6N223 TaxID=3457412 RepID=UPI003FD62620
MTVSTESRDGLALAAEFPRATREQWQRLVAGVLRRTGWAGEPGPDAEQALVTPLEDGVAARPLYAPGDGGVDDSPDPAAAVPGYSGHPDRPGHPGSPGYPGFAPFVRGGRPGGTALDGWEIRQRHEDPDPRRTNAAALDDLEHGATGLWLTAGAGGVPVKGLPAALHGVLLDLAPVTLEAGADAGPAAEAFLALLPRDPAPPLPPHCLGADPLGWAARTGRADGLPELTAAATGLATRCHRDHPGVRAWAVDALPYHEAGGTAAQELGCSLAAGVAALRELTAAGLDVAAAAGQLEFRYAADADQFLTISKLRAARRLWSRVVSACGGPVQTAGQRQHAVTSRVMMTRRDPHVNVLRTTVAALAAGVGGADAVTVLPFDDAVGLPDAAARRLARNTSLILLQESHLARVIDPAGGSWYVEDLTAQLCRAAWDWFQEIERAGGLAAALASGLVADRIAAAWERRSAALATRREAVTGVSEYADPAEAPLARAPKPPAPAGGLPRVRRDAAFETLRARSDAHAAATGSRPGVFLATLGPAAEHTPRLTFAASLFGAAGIETADGPAETYAAAASGTPVVCLCGSDGRYAERAASTAEALVAAGARHLVLAGRPGEHEAAYHAAGIDEFVFAGGDAPAFLDTVLDHLGVAR